MKLSRPIVWLLLTACLLGASGAWAEEKDPRPAAGVQDNSFLIEEAYNQEPGVVQHIATLHRQRGDWQFNFTQEWPIGSQTHQFSYSVPYSWIRNDDGRRVNGIGDMLVHYRYQAWLETATMPAFAPRVSLIMPTGSKRRGLGDGSFGLEALLPFSKIVTDRVSLHANAGLSTLFDVDGHRPTSYKLGGSAIYAVNRDFNLMLESLGEWEQTVNAVNQLEREFTFTISPGARYAWNFPALNELQIVAGAAMPVSFKRGEKTDVGVFVYLSFEHNFQSKTSAPKMTK